MIEIKRADLMDDRVIALLGRVTFDETFGSLFTYRDDLLTYLDQTFSVAKITSSLSKLGNHYFVAECDGLPVGYAKIKCPSASPFINGTGCQLQKIYVLKQFHHAGIGRLLHHALIDHIATQRYPHVWLSVLQSNTQAINFYKREDYQPVGEHQFTIGREVFDFNVYSKQLI